MEEKRTKKRALPRTWEDICADISAGLPISDEDLETIERARIEFGLGDLQIEDLCLRLYQSKTPRLLVRTSAPRLPPEIRERILFQTGILPYEEAALVSWDAYVAQRGAADVRCRERTSDFTRCATPFFPPEEWYHLEEDLDLYDGGEVGIPERYYRPLNCGKACAENCSRWMRSTFQSIKERHPLMVRDQGYDAAILTGQYSLGRITLAGYVVHPLHVSPIMWLGRQRGIQYKISTATNIPERFMTVDERRVSHPPDLAFVQAPIWTDHSSLYVANPAGYGPSIQTPATPESLCAWISQNPSAYTGIHWTFVADLLSPSDNEALPLADLIRLLVRLSLPLNGMKIPGSDGRPMEVFISPYSTLSVTHTPKWDSGRWSSTASDYVMKAYTTNRATGRWTIRWDGAPKYPESVDEVEARKAQGYLGARYWTHTIEDVRVLDDEYILEELPSIFTPLGRVVNEEGKVLVFSNSINVIGNGLEWDYS